MKAGKFLVLAVEASISAAVWWVLQTDDERRALRAGAWKIAQTIAGRVAIRAGYFALQAEQRYYEEVRT